MDKVTFIISSVIYFSDRKLSYSAVRSVFDPQQRSKQTLTTIASIREKVPSATIVLVEMGREKDIAPALLRSVDKYIYTGDNLLVKWATNSRHKGLGEAMGLLAASGKIRTEADVYFKISGRYFLNSSFDMHSWDPGSFCFKKYGKNVSTRLYSFGAKQFFQWKRALLRSMIELYKGRSIEEVIPKYISSIHDIEVLGISGLVAPDGTFLTE